MFPFLSTLSFELFFACISSDEKASFHGAYTN